MAALKNLGDFKVNGKVRYEWRDSGNTPMRETTLVGVRITGKLIRSASGYARFDKATGKDLTPPYFLKKYKRAVAYCLDSDGAWVTIPSPTPTPPSPERDR